MASLIILFSIFLIPIFLFFAVPSKSRTTRRSLPPGPRPLPLIGSFHLLGSLPHRSARSLSKTYGPILFIHLGSVKAVIISSISLAEEIIRANDLIFADRPSSEITEYITYGYKGFAFSEHSPYWRGAKKMVVSLVLSQTKLESFGFIRKQEMAVFVESLKKDAESGALVDVTSKVHKVVSDVSCRILFGQKECKSDDQISDHFHEMLRLIAAPNISDFVPFLGLFDLQKLRRRARAVMVKIDAYLEKTIDEHKKNRVRSADQGKEKDVVDNILEYMENKDDEFQFDHIGMKAIVLELLVGALDPSSVAIEWALVELIRQPTKMKRLQEELDRVVGRNRAVEESDLPELPYLQNVVKEGLRLHQVNPFLIRSAKEDTVVGGFHIPGGTMVIINNWAISRDSNVWANGDDFHPERFEKLNINVTGSDFRLLPFGSGRRGCPGSGFGLVMIPLVLAQLVHCFDWELPNGMSPSDIDMAEKYGLTMPKKVHVVATPVYRL